MQFYFSNTPHSTYRVFITKDITNFPNKTALLDFLSCWDQKDKVTPLLVSWEFAEDLPKKYIRKLLNNAEEFDFLNWE